MQPRSSTDFWQPNTKRTERVNNRLPLQTQGQAPIQLYIFYLTFDCIAKEKSFDVAFRVMDFMWENKLNPSDALIEEYRQSKTTKTLNRFPSKEDWMKRIDIDEEWYDGLKKAYRSKIIKIK